MEYNIKDYTYLPYFKEIFPYPNKEVTNITFRFYARFQHPQEGLYICMYHNMNPGIFYYKVFSKGQAMKLANDILYFFGEEQ